MTLCSGIASTLTNTTAVCTSVIAFLRSHQDRYTEGRSKEGASGAPAQRRKMGSKMDIFNVNELILFSQQILNY